MNWDHIASVMTGWLRSGRHEEQNILTNGHIMVAVPPDSPLGVNAKDYPKAAELWAGALAVAVQPETVGGLYVDGSKYYRQIGAWIFSEHYFRCFHGCTWTLSKEHALIHQDGVLVGIVMRCREGNQALAANQDVSDSDVFAPFASDQNNWYLVNIPTLNTKLEEAEDQQEAIQSRIDNLEKERDEWDKEADSLRRRLDTMKHAEKLPV